MNRPICCATGRSVLAIAGAAAAVATGGCGGGASGAPQHVAAASKAAASKTAASKTAEAPGPTNRLLATVKATGQVTLTDSDGHPAARVPSGWYTIFVTVNATGADFHLSGPSVDSATKAKVPGVALWGIHLHRGTYRYANDRAGHVAVHVLSVY